MAGKSIRDLFVRVGLQVDDSAPLDRFDNGISRLKKNVGFLKAALLGTAGALTGIGFALKQAGEFEQTEVAFEALLQNVDLSKQKLEELFEFARTTPFLIPEVLNTAKQLLALGTPADQIIQRLTALGNVAAGINRPLFNIADAFSKAEQSGFLEGFAFMQFRRLGVPIVKELAKITGRSGAELRKLGAEGGITFELLNEAFETITGKGGKFFQLMKKQSLTFLGTISNIKDSLLITSIRIGKGLLPRAREMAREFLEFLEINQKLIRIKGQEIFKKIGKGLLFAFKIASNLGSYLLALTDIFGGLGKTIKLATLALVTFLGLSTLSAIGNVTLGIITLTKSLKTMGIVGSLAGIKAFAFPLLVGAGVFALFLIIEDFISLLDGKESVIEQFLGKDSLRFVRQLKNDFDDFVRTMKLFVTTAASGFPAGFGLIKKGVQKSPINIGDINKAIDTFTLGGLSGISNLIGRGDIFGLRQTPAQAGGNLSFSPTINITGVGVAGAVDPIREIETSLENFWNEKIRETAVDVQRTERK